MSSYQDILLLRMTHIKNVPHILQHGITHISSPNANPAYEPIGDGSLIGKRNGFVVPNGKTLGDYTPFYFGTRTPMLYVIQFGFNGVKKIPAADIVYCITNIRAIEHFKLDFIFTDGHAVDDFSSFYDASQVSNIETIIDRKAIDTKYWRNETDLDLKRRKEAEFLVEGDIPPKGVAGFVVYNHAAKKTILAMKGIDGKKIFVNSNHYF